MLHRPCGIVCIDVCIYHEFDGLEASDMLVLQTEYPDCYL